MLMPTSKATGTGSANDAATSAVMSPTSDDLTVVTTFAQPNLLARLRCSPAASRPFDTAQ